MPCKVVLTFFFTKILDSAMLCDYKKNCQQDFFLGSHFYVVTNRLKAIDHYFDVVHHTGFYPCPLASQSAQDQTIKFELPCQRCMKQI